MKHELIFIVHSEALQLEFNISTICSVGLGKNGLRLKLYEA